MNMNAKLDGDAGYEYEEKKPADVESAAVHVHVKARELLYDGEEAFVDPIYRAKDKLLTDAFQEIGMGRYQVRSSYILLLQSLRMHISCS